MWVSTSVQTWQASLRWSLVSSRWPCGSFATFDPMLQRRLEGGLLLCVAPPLPGRLGLRGLPGVPPRRQESAVLVATNAAKEQQLS